ncbi:VOC family protein [Candidatus Sororendozoicomonas aggregata]|uniref:VOC family protein n=1 Tax=Candidatus Sororendozoicomonas aggregata TaxID=3073239 RepID=UPI002ED5FF8F
MSASHRIERLTHLALRIKDPAASLPFYKNVLGMSLVSETNRGQRKHFCLQYTDLQAVLELVYDAADTAWHPMLSETLQPGYWKIAIAVAELDHARACLLDKGVPVGDAFEVPDVAYLCHFSDPDGYCIELIQHRFCRNHRPQPIQRDYPLGGAAVFSLVTLRIKDSARSLAFYGDVLGMTLLSRQQVADRGFTLYFLACTDESPPVRNIDAIENREWLWQRPYTVLELQHIEGTEHQSGQTYNPDPVLGFEGLRFRRAGGYQPLSSGDSTTVRDPDGYTIHLYG